MKWIMAPSKRAFMGLILVVLLLIFGLGFVMGNMYGEIIPVLNQRLVPIYNVARNDNRIAVTLDGAWGADNTEKLLEIFEENGVTVTFFFAGIWLEKHPELVRKIAAAGHEIGNHTYHHTHCNSLSREEMIKELEDTSDLIEGLIGKRPRFFRPPFGEYSNPVISICNELGYQVIQWSLDSLDWQEPGTDYIIKRILDRVSSGDIILFHNNAPDTPAALRYLLPELKKRGFQPGPLSAVVYQENYYIESHSGRQVKKAAGGDRS